jgi:hypothetical protein
MSRIGFSSQRWGRHSCLPLVSLCRPRVGRTFLSALVLLPSASFAGSYAAGVVSYTPGASNASFRTPAAALGPPDDVSGENPAATNYFGFPNVLSPFSPAYQGDEIVQIGEGGQLTLQLANFVNVGPGKRLGVISNVGLLDTNGSGQAGNPAAIFGGGTAHVKVSKDNQTWFDLGNVVFNVPSLYYVNAGPYDSAPPPSPQLTDFGKPFEGALASFNAKDFAGVVDAFKVAAGGYSGGGTWLDLSTTGLAEIGYVQFLVDDDNNANTSQRFNLDALTIANSAVGAAIPEPGSLGLLSIVTLLTLRRRRR